MKVHHAAAVALIAAAVFSGAASARAEDAPASPTPPSPPPEAQAQAPPAVTASLPIRLFGNVNVRDDFQDPVDRPDLLLDPNQVNGLVARIRFGFEFKDEHSTASGGIRFSTGESPNPTSPFVRIGNGFREVPFGIDQYYINLRPFRDKQRFVLSLGKIPLPFWKGEFGAYDSQMIFDHDVSPVGGAFHLNLYRKKDEKQSVSVDNVAGLFIIEWFRRDRFAGLVNDIYLVADQLKVKVHRFTFAGGFYNWENLNSGARSPSFVPGSTIFLLPGQSAFLVRPGFQRGNTLINLGPDAFGFGNDRFRVVEALGQVNLPVRIPFLGKSEAHVVGHWAHNFTADFEEDAYGVTVGFTGGDYGRKVHPYTLWGTWRKVEADATIAAFTDSDLGAGTNYRGFEVSADYKFTRHLTGYVSYFDAQIFPRRSPLQRLFFGLTWGF